MGGGHSSPRHIPQQILKNPNVINKSSNPSFFIYKEGFYGNTSKRLMIIMILLLLLFLIFFYLSKMKNI
jgi:hypothetical protein